MSKGHLPRVAYHQLYRAYSEKWRMRDVRPSVRPSARCPAERGAFIDNLLVRIHLIIEMVLVDRPCAMGV